MHKNTIYVCASEDWTTGYFVKYMADGWHIVQWSCGEAEIQPVYYDSCSVSEIWAENSIKRNGKYPVYQEYEYVSE